jgi:hypothetical protein
VLDIGGGERGGGIGARFVDAGGERFFALLQFEHALLDRALGDEFVDKGRLVLADAVGGVGGLVLNPLGSTTGRNG